MDAHETIRIYQEYRALWDSLQPHELGKILGRTGYLEVEEFHKHNFAGCIQIIDFLRIDTREKSYSELVEEVSILSNCMEVITMER